MQQKHPLEAREVMTKIHRKNKTPSASRAFDLNFLRLGLCILLQVKYEEFSETDNQ